MTKPIPRSLIFLPRETDRSDSPETACHPLVTERSRIFDLRFRLREYFGRGRREGGSEESKRLNYQGDRQMRPSASEGFDFTNSEVDTFENRSTDNFHSRENPLEPEILVVVASTGAPPFSRIEDAQRRTWLAQTDGLKVIFFQGDAALGKRPPAKLLGDFLGRVQKLNYRWPRTLDIASICQSRFIRAGFMSFSRLGRLPSEIHLGWAAFFNWVYERGNFFSKIVGSLQKKIWSDEVVVVGDRAKTAFPAHWYMLAPVNFIKYRFILENYDFDFVLFTNVTCYLRADKLREALRNQPRSRFYGGHVLEVMGHVFVPGNSVVMSQDVVSGVLHLRNHFRLDIPDDVALGRLIRDWDLAEPVNLPTEHLPFGASIPEDLSSDWETRHIIRCKGEEVTRTADPAVDLMERLHDYIQSTTTGL